MPDLGIEVNGMKFPNPFVLASGPPGTNGKVIQRSFGLGWGGIVCKTLSLENEKVANVVPRYGKLKSREDGKQVIGFQNIELISDRPFEVWLDELAECKQAYPDHVLIGQVQGMPGYVNRLRLRFDRPGRYDILCLELCGNLHSRMRGVIQVTGSAS